MEKDFAFKRIRDLGLIAVIRGPSEEKTIRAVEALVNGGVRGIEITFSTPNAITVASQLAKKYHNDILLGMGTLTQVDQVNMAIDSGAQFIVSPIFEPNLVNAFLCSNLLTMVGCFSPSEVFNARQAGADIIKIFPGRLAGPEYIKDLRGPFPDISFIPTGGVEIGNISEWFKVGVLAVGAGSSLCPKELMINEDFLAITKIATRYAGAVNLAKNNKSKQKGNACEYA